MDDRTELTEHLGDLIRGDDWWSCSCGRVLATWLDDARARRAAHLLEVHERIVAARVSALYRDLATQNTRIAAVERLADEWEAQDDDDPYDPACPGCYARDLRAALSVSDPGQDKENNR